jgi:hypothetical protein
MVIWHAYLLGTRVAEYARRMPGADEGDIREKHFAIIVQIAQGDLTLISSPQEFLAEHPGLSDDVKQDLPAILAEGRRYERDIATFLLNFTMQAKRQRRGKPPAEPGS